MKSSVQVLKSNARYFALLCGDNLVPLRAVCEETDLSQTRTKVSLTTPMAARSVPTLDCTLSKL